jgi:hypothetical protein
MGAVATIVGRDSQETSIHRGFGDEPLPPGANLADLPDSVRQVSRRESRDYFATSRGFETPPIDPLGQTPILDRPLFQR